MITWLLRRIARFRAPRRPLGVWVTWDNGVRTRVDDFLKYTGWDGQCHMWSVDMGVNPEAGHVRRGDAAAVHRPTVHRKESAMRRIKFVCASCREGQHCRRTSTWCDCQCLPPREPQPTRGTAWSAPPTAASTGRRRATAPSATAPPAVPGAPRTEYPRIPVRAAAYGPAPTPAPRRSTRPPQCGRSHTGTAAGRGVSPRTSARGSTAARPGRTPRPRKPSTSPAPIGSLTARSRAGSYRASVHAPGYAPTGQHHPYTPTALRTVLPQHQGDR